MICVSRPEVNRYSSEMLVFFLPEVFFTTCNGDLIKSCLEKYISIYKVYRKIQSIVTIADSLNVPKLCFIFEMKVAILHISLAKEGGEQYFL